MNKINKRFFKSPRLKKCHILVKELQQKSMTMNKIICFFFGHKEIYFYKAYGGSWKGWKCKRCGKQLRGRYNIKIYE